MARYDVVAVRPDGNSARLPGAVTLIHGGQGVLQTSIAVPAVLSYHGLGTLTVQYTNTGTAAMPAPITRTRIAM